jgi:hypothetical protein
MVYCDILLGRDTVTELVCSCCQLMCRTHSKEWCYSFVLPVIKLMVHPAIHWLPWPSAYWNLLSVSHTFGNRIILLPILTLRYLYIFHHFVLRRFVTKSIGENSCWESENRSDGKEHFRLLWHLKVEYRVHRSEPSSSSSLLILSL